MIPAMIEAHLRERYRGYEHRTHAMAGSAQELAEAEHVSGYCVAKPVVLKLDGKLALAVVAATDHVQIEPLEESTGSRARLVGETEFAERFRPCEAGAEPPLAMFGVPIFVDDKLICERKLLMAAGTHEDAVVLSTSEWMWCERAQPIVNLGRRAPASAPCGARPERAAGSRRGDPVLVRDAMTPDAATIDPDETLEAAARHMKDKGVGVLAVCQEGDVIGIITDRDIVVRAVAQGRDPEAADVRSAMTPQIIACRDDDDLADAVLRMERRAVRRVVVLDATNRLVGMLSVDDVALYSWALAGEIVEHAHVPERTPMREAWPWYE